MRIRLAAVALVFMGGAACGDSGTGVPADNFPAIDPAFLQTYCVRGTAPPPAIRAGSLGTLDCSTTGTAVGFNADSYYETWRVRVTEAREVTFSLDSDFDTVLDLFQVSVSNPALSFNEFLAVDDDSGVNLNAELVFNLVPDTEYWIAVSGFEATDVGNYTLSVN